MGVSGGPPALPHLDLLVVDDSEDEAGLVLREIRAGFAIQRCRRVWSAEGLRAALAEPWDAIVSDWAIPRFGGLEAYEIVRAAGLDVPFILVSGTVDEEVAVTALKAGVHDFVTKGRLTRLRPSLVRELREAENRRLGRDARDRATQSEDRYRLVFERNPQAMWIASRADGRIRQVNHAALALYGYTAAELAAMTVDELTVTRDGVTHHRRRDGSLVAVELASTPLTIDGVDVSLTLVADVTSRERALRELRETEDRLRHAQKMDALGRLAGGVAHDFNNVLTVIVTLASFLEDGLPSPHRDDAIEIRRAAERGSQITRQLLALGRHSHAKPELLQVHEVIAQFAPMLRRLVGERIALALRCPPLGAVVADRTQLEQVLMNLAVNARDAMDDGGKLTIETSVATTPEDGLAPGSYVVIALTDSGVGMSPETQQRIFEPFFTTKEAGRGTGLGLSIVHGIVTQAGGVVRVYSELGHGTTVRVKLPLAQESTAVAAAPAIAPPTELPAVTVLVVDDQREIRAITTRILQDAGCRVLEAATAEEARRVCVTHEGPIAVALIDIVLTDARGDVLAHELQKLRPELAVVPMSGYPAGALTPRGGVPPDLLAKPFSPADVRVAIARALRLDAPTRARPPRAPRRVVVVDDDAMVRTTIARALRRREFEVAEAESGAAALVALESEPADLVVSDLQMPGMSGLELLAAVRRVDLDIPVVLMTGDPELRSAQAAIEYGAFRYLTKPIDVDTLVRTVEIGTRACSLARLRREATAIGGARHGAVDRAGLEVRFEQAVERMWMAYQPIHEPSGAVLGVEALLRSDEPSMPGPGHVLDAAVELGRLAFVGRQIRRLAASALVARPDLTLFVNLHANDVFDADLIDPAAPLSAIASRVVLELTERAALRSSDELVARLARLRAMGYRLALDDIGAGYNGLTSFTDLMPEIVKIDMSLVRDIHQSALKQRTVAALCRLCREVGCTVVGEGVETLDERDCLIDLGCELLQGFYLGRPARELPRPR